MVTVWPSCLPISAIVVTGEDIDLWVSAGILPAVATAACPRNCGRVARRTAAGTAALLRGFQLFEGSPQPFQRVHFFILSDFQQQRRSLRGRAQQLHSLFPVDGSLPRPQMRIFILRIVVNVGRANMIS